MKRRKARNRCAISFEWRNRRALRVPAQIAPQARRMRLETPYTAYMMGLLTEDTSVDVTRNIILPAPKKIFREPSMRANLSRGVSCAVLALSGISAFAAAGNRLSFSPSCDVQAEVVADGQKVTVTVKKNDEVATDAIQIETEKKLQLAVDDFNFDGHSDFSISHTDDGMGTYTISEIYVTIQPERTV